jgi:4-hydroxyphenylpyruvate dioxygenase-like putative hemolysin
LFDARRDARRSPGAHRGFGAQPVPLRIEVPWREIMFSPNVFPNAGQPGPQGGGASVRHIDHVTYVTAREDEKAFLATWARLGFAEHVRLCSYRHPATHIALISGVSEDYPWATMTGLSVSEDPKSAINEFVRRYGAAAQHIAYNIDPHFEMERVYGEMKESGWNFMTPVLTYEDKSGAHLRQFFTAPAIPYGPFVEFIQRLAGPDTRAFDGFDSMNIDGLYDHYVDYSRSLDRRK